VEISMQLMDKAGQCQVKDANIGMASSIGGLGSSCAVTILRRN
jgi:hypothetical protein